MGRTAWSFGGLHVSLGDCLVVGVLVDMLVEVVECMVMVVCALAAMVMVVYVLVDKVWALV